MPDPNNPFTYASYIPVVGGPISSVSEYLDPSHVDTTSLDEDKQRARNLYSQLMMDRAVGGQQAFASTAAAPTAVNPTQIDATQAQQTRAQQEGNLATLQAAAEGRAPSVADAQFAQANSNLAAQQQGLAAQAHGNAGVFARQEAMRNIASGQAQNALGASMTRAQEQATARGQLTGALSDVRGADTGLALSQAQLTAAANEANANRLLSTNQLNAQLATGVSTSNAAQNNAYRLGLGNQALGASGQATGVSRTEAQMQQDYLNRKAKAGGNLINAGADAIGAIFSDERLKSGIKDVPIRAAQKLARSLKLKSYSYENPETLGEGYEGEHVGVIAQDLERDELGRKLVHEDSATGMKKVDYHGLAMTLMAAALRSRKARRA